MRKMWLGAGILAGLLVGTPMILPSPGGGQQTLYKWVDDQGTVHFTDDFYSIPLQYRSQVEQRQLAPSQGNTPPKESEGTKPAAGSPPQAGAPGSKEPVGKEGTLYGGQTEEEWKKAFSDLTKKIQQLQSDLTQKKTYVQAYERGQRMGSSYSKVEIGQYDQYKKEVPTDEANLKNLQSQLEELTRKATYFGVPRRIREQ